MSGWCPDSAARRWRSSSIAIVAPPLVPRAPPSHEYPLPMPARYVTLPARAGRSRGIVIVIRGPGGRSRSWRGQGRCAGRFYGSYEVPGTHTAGSANVGQTAVAVTEGEDLPCLALCASRVTPALRCVPLAGWLRPSGTELPVLGSSLVRCLWWSPGGGHDLPAPLWPAIAK